MSVKKSGRQQLKTRRLNAYNEQHGRCYWCNGRLIRPGTICIPRGGQFPDNLCTIDHLDERFTKRRGKARDGKKKRTVAACYRCNSEREVLVRELYERDEAHRLGSVLREFVNARWDKRDY